MVKSNQAVNGYCFKLGKDKERDRLCLLYALSKIQWASKAVDKREYLGIIRDNFCHFCTKRCDPSSEPSR